MAGIDCIVAAQRRDKTTAPLRVKGVGVAITKGQRNLHVGAEALAVFLVAPLTGYIALTAPIPRWQRQFLGVVAVGTVVIDGFLLYRYTRERRE